MTTGPLTLLTLVNLFAAWRASGSVRGWWLAASFIVLAERLFTFAYFIPTMVRLTGAADSPESVAAAMRWSSLNYFRHLLVFSGWLSALKALSRALRAARRNVLGLARVGIGGDAGGRIRRRVLSYR